MDTVGALNKFRLGVTNDKYAFQVLCFLYKDNGGSEEDLLSNVDITASNLKGTLRSLFQANLVRLANAKSYKLTLFGESLLSSLGLDEIIAPFIIDELDIKHAPIKAFIRHSIRFEPERAHSITQALRALRSVSRSSESFYERELSDDYKWSIILYSGIHPDSKMRTLLSNDFLCEGISGRRSSLDIVQGLERTVFSNDKTTEAFKRALEWLNVSDQLVCRAAADDLEVGGTPKEIERLHSVLISLRIANNLHSDWRDSLLEKCTRLNELTPLNLWRNAVRVAPWVSVLWTQLMREEVSLPWATRTERHVESADEEYAIWFKKFLQQRSDQDSADSVEKLGAAADWRASEPRSVWMKHDWESMLGALRSVRDNLKVGEGVETMNPVIQDALLQVVDEIKKELSIGMKE